MVSGINSGLNARINVLYSGTVAAAIEGAFSTSQSVAVSLEYDVHADYARAAAIAQHSWSNRSSPDRAWPRTCLT